MSFLKKLFGAKAEEDSIPDDPPELAMAFLLEAQKPDRKQLPAQEAILAASPKLAAATVLEILSLLLPENEETRERHGLRTRPPVVSLLLELLRERELSFTDEQVVQLLDFAERGPHNSGVYTAINRFLTTSDSWPTTIETKLRKLLAVHPAAAFKHLDVARRRFQPVERWAALLDGADRSQWQPLFEHCLWAAAKSKPTKKFLAESEPLVEDIDDFCATLGRWLEVGGPAGDNPSDEYEKQERGIFKGLLWVSAAYADDPLCTRLSDFAERCFRDGDRPLGNAATRALGLVPGDAGPSSLARVGAKVKQRSANKQIDRVLNEVAARSGVSRTELDEVSVPDFGLEDGQRRSSLGDFTAELRLTAAGAELSWFDASGKKRAGVPKAIKDGFATELAELKRERKELDGAAQAQVQRLERLWLRSEPLPVGVLEQRYLEHGLIGCLASRLIWSIGDTAMALWRSNRFESLGGEVIVADDAVARLWHPLGSKSSDDVVVWRDWLAELGVSQPFPQLYRDTYRAMAGREDDRFAGHVLDQYSFRRHCQARRWDYQLQGYWSDEGGARRDYPQHRVFAAFDIDPIEQDGSGEAYPFVVSGACRFRSLDTGDIIEPSEVDEIVFSESLRSVGLLIEKSMVSAKSAQALESPFQEHWQRSAWGELSPAAEIRAEILAGLLPRTVLRDSAAVDGPWLTIAADAESHRIHIGSGLVEGVDVPTRASASATREAQAVFLPNEGDPILRRVLEQAFAIVR